ncbi:MAG: chromate transporter [Burkholderiales bacterium]|nr:chromate transporter [Burkholderiales bacterium]
MSEGLDERRRIHSAFRGGAGLAGAERADHRADRLEALRLPGALAGLAAFCVPAAALAYWTGRLWDRMREAPWREKVQRALVPVTVGLVLSGGWLLATPLGADDWRTGAIAGASAAALYATRLNPLWILAAGGALGVALFDRRDGV